MRFIIKQYSSSVKYALNIFHGLSVQVVLFVFFLSRFQYVFCLGGGGGGSNCDSRKEKKMSIGKILWKASAASGIVSLLEGYNTRK